MTNAIFRKLQQRLDHYSIGFPATKSGIELEILKKLFSLQDATIFLSMTQKLETSEQISQRTGRPPAGVAAQLEDMTERGLLFRIKHGGAVKYGAIPFVHGLMEFQVKDLDRHLAEMVEKYHAEGFSKTYRTVGGMFLRTVPIQKAIDVTHHVAAYDDAVKILSEKEFIVLTDCFCRK